jgi:large subunit ribosomal protein L7/L12
MAKIEDTIATLEAKLKQAKAKKQLIEAQKRTAQAKAKRAEDTRRKVLMGAFVLERLEAGGVSAQSFQHGGKLFSSWLTRDDDRALFGLPPETPTTGNI